MNNLSLFDLWLIRSFIIAWTMVGLCLAFKLVWELYYDEGGDGDGDGDGDQPVTPYGIDPQPDPGDWWKREKVSK